MSGATRAASRTHRLRRFTLVVCLLVAAPAGAQHGDLPGLPPGPAVLRGIVLGPDGPVPGVPVTLYALTAGGRPGIGDTRTDASGRFEFAELANDAEVAYLLGARYGGVPFSQRLGFTAGQTQLEVEIEVSAPLADLGSVRVSSTRIRFDWAGSQLAVRETQVLLNPTKQILFVEPSKRALTRPLRVSVLPEGATDFTRLPMAGDELELIDGEIAFWGPLFPGEQELVYQYRLPASSGRQTITSRFPVGTDGVSIAYPPAGPQVEAMGFSSGGSIEIEGVAYESLVGTALEADASLTLTLSLPEMRRGADALHLTRSDLFLELDDASLIVNQDLTIEVDPGPPLVAEAGEALVRLELPSGAQLIGMSPESAAIGASASGNQVEIAGPLSSGTTRFGFRYVIGVEGDEVELDLRFPQTLSTLLVKIADTGDLVVSSSRLHRLRPVRSGTRMYLQREAFHVEPGERVDLRIARPLKTPLPRTAAVVLMLAVGAGACVYLMRPLRRDPEEIGEEVASISRERSLVYASIHDLDHDFETGKVAEADYHGMRSELRLRAIELLRRERQPAPAPLAEIHPMGKMGEAPQAPTETGAFCPSCGDRVAPTWRFCSHCGGGLTPRARTGSGE